MTPPSNQVFGPLVSVSDTEAHVRLFSDVFGMQVAGRHTVERRETLDAISPRHTLERIELTVLTTPGTRTGVVLVDFGVADAPTVRDWSTRVHLDALKVIDFYAPDFGAAVAHARARGYEVIESEASYELAEGTFREAHLWGPDNVVTAFLGGPAEFFADFAQVTDALVSEVQSISAPLSDASDSVAFYRDVLGWNVVYEYALDDPSFAAMLGVEHLTLRSRNVGPNTREPYFGLIDYGLPGGADDSLTGRSVPPHRGLLGAVVLTHDIAAIHAAAGLEAVPVVLQLPSLESDRAAWLTTPHTVPHLVLEVEAPVDHPREEEGTTSC
ncbi:hypothetical protein [Nocardioides yefusunii]|uniref:VOC domain-containing protein n=1 Tax=Nocardioides yefusunii TaxID=2500546 RepID=A0ABW1QUV9_9ACTN|nr:hypothetical protein [Nocardioides yefusunii]